MKPIVPARLEFRDGVPCSVAYGDIYHSADGAAGQARHVFLEGCGLPDAWAGRDAFVMLETGFGTGLNFLTTWAAWRDDPARCGRLHFLSVEKHPFTGADLAHLHAQWPEFETLSRELRASWPMLVPGFHRIALDGGRVQLTLMLGDAADCLPQLEARVDAFYLDGFAPDCNPDLWTPALLGTLAKRARPGATAATYSVAAPVRQGLAQAGFVCEKRRGFGGKRHCLTGRYAGTSSPAEPAAPPQRVVVVGAGVAGAAVAHALAQRGVAVTLLERSGAVAAGASGNPLGVFRPLVSRDDTLASRLTRASFLHNLRAWAALSDVAWSCCGVLHLAKDADAAVKQRQALTETAPPPEFARWVEQDEARALADWPVDGPGMYYPAAGWVEPATLVRAWLDHPAIRLQTDCAAARIQATPSGWQVRDAAGAVLAEAEAVVLANAYDARLLLPDAAWPLHAVRGQVTRLPPGSLPDIQRVIAREGYVVPGGQPLVGATYEHDDDITPRAASDAANLARLEAILPGAAARFDAGGVSGRAALRATLPDRLPLVGAVGGRPGVYVAVGYGSRGLVWAGLLGEALADRMSGQPLPLEQDLMRAIAPGRYTR